MGDDWYASLKGDRQARHAEWKAKNLQLIHDSGLSFRLGGHESVLFRDPGKPSVDFYPSTGRWRVVKPPTKKTFRGGAKAFLRWYAAQLAIIALTLLAACGAPPAQPCASGTVECVGPSEGLYCQGGEQVLVRCQGPRGCDAGACDNGPWPGDGCVDGGTWVQDGGELECL